MAFGYFIAGWNAVRFEWPKGSEGAVTVSSRELRWLLDGLTLTQRHAHPKVTANTVI